MWIPWVRGIALFTAQRYEAAIRSLKQVANPNTEVRGWLAASLAMNGRTAEAKAMLDDLLRLAESDMAVFPGRRLRDFFWRQQRGTGAKLTAARIYKTEAADSRRARH